MFPAGINAAATWSRSLIRKRGEALGAEFRDKGIGVFEFFYRPFKPELEKSIPITNFSTHEISSWDPLLGLWVGIPPVVAISKLSGPTRTSLALLWHRRSKGRRARVL